MKKFISFITAVVMACSAAPLLVNAEDDIASVSPDRYEEILEVLMEKSKKEKLYDLSGSGPIEAGSLYSIGEEATKKLYSWGTLKDYPVKYDCLLSTNGVFRQRYYPDKVSLRISFDYDEERFWQDSKYKASEHKKWSEIENLAKELVCETSTSYVHSYCSKGKMNIEGDKINVKKMLEAIEEVLDIKSYTVVYGSAFTEPIISKYFPLEGFRVYNASDEEKYGYNCDSTEFLNYIASGEAPKATYGVVYNKKYAPEGVQGQPYDIEKIPNKNEGWLFCNLEDLYYIEITPENALELDKELFNCKWGRSSDECMKFLYAIPEEQTEKAQIDLFLDIENKFDIHLFEGFQQQGGGSETTGIEISSEDIIDGDANNDKKLTIADSAAILQSLANADKYGLSLIGELNADVYEPGSGISGLDALRVQEMVASKGEV